jgi:hypothetical protein
MSLLYTILPTLHNQGIGGSFMAMKRQTSGGKKKPTLVPDQQHVGLSVGGFGFDVAQALSKVRVWG